MIAAAAVLTVAALVIVACALFNAYARRNVASHVTAAIGPRVPVPRPDIEAGIAAMDRLGRSQNR
ncbi:hypothetical protein [Arthrobacter sp. Alg241-R88]|uniref:hypothetical protein n=1 Tax=Arthrobacter sp. Alg241-R88 TaxID=2305984 RepID=UPI0013D30A7B|nr:hypothetical protein [Arthrobacter sp. Alg241-R88]